MWEGGSIPKTRFSERREMSSIKKKNQFRGRRGGSIGKLPKEKPEFRGRREFRGRTVVEKKTEFKRQQGIRSDRFLTG